MTAPGQKVTQKWISFYDLRDACAMPGCPVCTLQVRAASRYLENLFYERVTDMHTRVRLHRSLGFCLAHAWQATRVRDSESGIATIYESLLLACQKRLQHIRQATRRLKPVSGWFDRWRAKVNGRVRLPRVRWITAPCPICDHVQFFEELYLRELLDFFTDEEMRRAYERSFGLCLPHVDRAIELFSDHENLSLLLEAQLEKIEDLRGELNEYLRKLDYQFASEPKGAEATAWRRAVEMMVGKPPPSARKG